MQLSTPVGERRKLRRHFIDISVKAGGRHAMSMGTQVRERGEANPPALLSNWRPGSASWLDVVCHTIKERLSEE